MNIAKYCSVCGKKLEFRIKISRYDEYTGEPIVALRGVCRGHISYESKDMSLKDLIKDIDSQVKYTLDDSLKKGIK
jgi:hypothetical protein